MIFVTGDIHGELERFQAKEIKALKKTDTLIILGDFGFLWAGTAAEKKALDWLAKRPYRVLFLDGCHENFDLLNAYPVVELLGGKAHHLGGNLYHICRGSLLTLENRTLFCLGGGESADVEDREEGVNWWRQELPEPEEITACRALMEARGWQADYILTHDAPSRILEFMGVPGQKEERLNVLQIFLNELNEKGQYSRWLFGRYHQDRRLGTKMQEVFCDVIKLESEEPKRKSRLFRKG